MPKEWTDEEVQDEINKAVQIVREDRIDTLLRNRLSAPSGNPGNSENDPPKSGDNSGNDNSGNPGNTGTKKRSLWWGDTE